MSKEEESKFIIEYQDLKDKKCSDVKECFKSLSSIKCIRHRYYRNDGCGYKGFFYKPYFRFTPEELKNLSIKNKLISLNPTVGKAKESKTSFWYSKGGETFWHSQYIAERNPNDYHSSKYLALEITLTDFLQKNKALLDAQFVSNINKFFDRTLTSISQADVDTISLFLAIDNIYTTENLTKILSK